jgi:hypothetical protein
MTDKSNIESIRQSTQILLECGDDFALMKKAVDGMYTVFSEITGVTIHHLNEDKDIFLPTGKAIGAAGAAHCLLEMKRTAVFLRGINKAILHKQQEKKGSSLRILYAGTGPYGTLVIPLLLLYPMGEIKVDLLEINSDSLAALQKVIETLAIDNCIGEIYNSDAATFKISHSYDIVVSETMQACLKKEPQVAIMQNLIPQLLPETIFIPEEISIDASLKKRGIWNGGQLLEEGGKRSFLTQIFTVNKTNLDNKNYRRVIHLPQSLNGPHDLLLYTTITVFENEVLGENDCSLNIPQRYFEFQNNYPKAIEFWYKQSDKPRIESRILDYITSFIN